jgi:hypothetical protein
MGGVIVGGGVLVIVGEFEGETVGTGAASPGISVCATQTGAILTSIVITPIDVMPQRLGSSSPTPAGRSLSNEQLDVNNVDNAVNFKSFLSAFRQNKQRDN